MKGLKTLLLAAIALMGPAAAKAQGATAQQFEAREVAPGRFETGALPDGNYLVTLRLATKKKEARATVFAESRRLYLHHAALKKKEPAVLRFCVNKRDSILRGDRPDKVRLKPGERQKLNWDDKLSVEVTGDNVACTAMQVEAAPQATTTVWLCGNSTVVDQDKDPWASWGQMIPLWFDEKVCFANLAESGESASTFISAKRWAKIMSLIRPGDYVLIEFGHNDQKQKWAGAGAYYNFSTALKTMIDEARAHQATPILVTPTCRRFFDGQGKVTPTHGDYPDAIRQVARREGVGLIDLQEMTRDFYEALGEEASKKAFVHYPAGTFVGQDKPLADNTHFNPYGAYEIAKMVVEGMKRLQLPFLASLRPDYVPFSPKRPDSPDSFPWEWSKDITIIKPDGN